MTIQIERITHCMTGQIEFRCCVPECTAAATWLLIDRDMPATHVVNLGERPCCTAHIASTYVSLRGAHIIARGSAGSFRREAERDRMSERQAMGAIANEG